jgi:murein DD-endopeptidase MepM/ murein hydrolase activator NlpD
LPVFPDYNKSKIDHPRASIFWLFAWLKYIAQILKKINELGNQKFTVMFIPHSEKRVINLKINVYLMVFGCVLLAFVLIGFFFLSTQYSGSSRIMASKDNALNKSEASLEIMREELTQLQKSTAVFENTLENTLGALGIDKSVKNTPQNIKGDLSTFLGLEEIEDSDIQELAEIKNLNDFLVKSVEPLNEITNVLQAQKDLLVDIPTLWPLKGVRGRITANFGPSEHPFTHQWYLHKGIDIAYGYGVPIVSTAEGKVIEVEYEPMNFGNHILIRHKYGFYTKYGHLQQVNVTTGQEIQQGQVIGTMGSTGLSTGPHLHYEVRIGSEVVDPSKYLNIASGINTQRIRN